MSLWGVVSTQELLKQQEDATKGGKNQRTTEGIEGYMIPVSILISNYHAGEALELTIESIQKRTA